MAKKQNTKRKANKRISMKPKAKAAAKIERIPNAVGKEEFLEGHQKETSLQHVALKEISLIYDFSLRVVKEFGSLIKSVVVFGSFARGKINEKSDVDLLIIVDDASVELTPDIMAFYNRELDSILKKEGSALKFHLTTVALSEYFDTVRRGDPLIINIVRTGRPIIDSGFFAPMKKLLAQGKLRPTWEAIELSKNRASYHLGDYSGATLVAATSLYWAAVEAAHAAVMTKGSTPASPELITAEMERLGLGTEEDRKAYQGIYDLMKTIVHKQKMEISPEELRFWKDSTTRFVESMAKICSEYKE